MPPSTRSSDSELTQVTDQQSPKFSSKSISHTITHQNNGYIAYDKTNYTIIQDPPSPSSPSLTQSMSASNSHSTNSPREPTTPPPSTARGRASSRNRYPDLGRVPLHRRGTSKTYECLEDLLREAGYKETRVFTPESERAEAEADERAKGVRGVKADAGNPNQRGSMRDGVGAVVGFLAGLIPSAVSRSSSLHRVSNLSDEQPSGSEPPEERVYSPPASPLVQKRIQKRKYAQEPLESSTPSTPTTLSSTGSLCSSQKPNPPTHSHSPFLHTPHLTHSHSHPPTGPTHRHQLSHEISHSQPPRRPSNASPVIQPGSSFLQQQQTFPNPSHPSFHVDPPTPIAKCEPAASRAGAYLRHMASAPNMSKRPSSTPTTPHTQRFAYPHQQNIVSLTSASTRGNGEGEEDPCEPPLPQTWLESVARAVLFGGAGAHPGGPSAPDINKRKVKQTRRSVSRAASGKSKSKSKSRSGMALSDHTNKAKANSSTNETGVALGLSPPELFTRISRGRARRSEGEVSRTRVVCRSAPTSRSGSKVRGGGERKEKNGGEYGFLMDGDWDGDGEREQRGRKREKGRKGNLEGKKDGLPSLARTKVEGEAWVGHQTGKVDGGAKNDNRYLSGWGADPGPVEDRGAEGRYQGEEGGSSSEEEEGELDLARMLVPPKRQNSIRSLRRHLMRQAGGVGPGAGVVPGLGTVKAMGKASGSGSDSRWGRDGERDLYLDGDLDREVLDRWGTVWVRKRGRGRVRMEREEDDGEALGVGSGFEFAGESSEAKSGRSWSRTGRNGTGKRMGLPAAWAGLPE